MAATASPDTYAELYAHRGDQFMGTYQTLFDTTEDHTLEASAVLTRLALSTNNVGVPKVMLHNLAAGAGQALIAVHRPVMCPMHPTTTSPLDGHVFVFRGEKPRGDTFIDMVDLEETSFEIIGPVRVYTIAQTQALVAAHADQEEGLLDGPTATTAHTEEVTVRRSILVPFPMVSEVLEQGWSPIQFWSHFITPIVGDAAKEADLGPLINWLRVAITKVHVPPTGMGAAPPDDRPANDCGDLATYFPPIRVSSIAHAHRRRAVLEDFPQYATSVDNTDRVLALVDAMRAEAAVSRTEAAEERASRSARKPVSKVYPHTVRYYRRLSGCPEDGSGDRDLPELYKELANAKSSEKRTCIQQRLTLRASEAGSASNIAPVITKEVLAMIEQGVTMAPTIFQLEDLTAGLNPFTCGWFQGTTKGDKVYERQVDFDNQQSGDTTITLAESRLLATKDVHFPTTTWEATQMLNGISLVLDEVHGAGHDHARLFRVFLANQWPDVTHSVEAMSPTERQAIPTLWPRVLRDIQLTMGEYMRKLLAGEAGIPTPDYASVHRLAMHRQWSFLAPIPARYLAEVPPASPAPPTYGGGGAGLAGGGGDDAADRAVTNPNVNRVWKRKYDDCDAQIRQLRQKNPPKDSDNTEVCLSWHLRGQCYANCQRRSTHRNLTGAVLRRMNQFVNEHCVTITGGGSSGSSSGKGTSTSEETP